jgi:hypothetical protein
LKPRRLETVAVLLILVQGPQIAWAQTLSHRGFLEGRGTLFPQEAPNDPTHVVADFIGREELFVKPTTWLQFAGGIDVRANSHDQVEDSWRVDFGDRRIQRPAYFKAEYSQGVRTTLACNASGALIRGEPDGLLGPLSPEFVWLGRAAVQLLAPGAAPRACEALTVNAWLLEPRAV